MFKYLPAMALVAVSSTSFAATTPIDVTAVTDAVAAVATPVGLIGAAVLILTVAIKSYKWVRRAM